MRFHFSSSPLELARIDSCYNPRMKTLRDSETQREIRERVRQVAPDTPRQWGRMTAHQMICHLADSFRGVLGEKTLPAAPAPLPRKIMKFIALGLPMHWPHGLKTVPEIDQHGNGTRPTEFAADVASLGSLFERFVSDPRALAPMHPFFGPMSHADWMRWGYLHMDHHLRQFGK
jgi:Protein of unknown function (DUF1569)